MLLLTEPEPSPPENVLIIAPTKLLPARMGLSDLRGCEDEPREEERPRLSPDGTAESTGGNSLIVERGKEGQFMRAAGGSTIREFQEREERRWRAKWVEGGVRAFESVCP